jgi:ribosomal protein L22
MSSFSETYGIVIQPFIAKFKEATNAKLRKAVLSNAAESVRKHRENIEEKGEELPKEQKDLQKVRPVFFFLFRSMFLCSYLQAVARYIKKTIKEGEEEEEDNEDDHSQPLKIKQVYNARDVVMQKYSSRVNKEIPFKPSDRGAYVSRFKNAVTTVLNGLNEKERKEVDKLVETWNKQGPPPDFQLK